MSDFMFEDDIKRLEMLKDLQVRKSKEFSKSLSIVKELLVFTKKSNNVLTINAPIVREPEYQYLDVNKPIIRYTMDRSSKLPIVLKGDKVYVNKLEIAYAKLYLTLYYDTYYTLKLEFYPWIKDNKEYPFMEYHLCKDVIPHTLTHILDKELLDKFVEDVDLTDPCITYNEVIAKNVGDKPGVSMYLKRRKYLQEVKERFLDNDSYSDDE